MQLKTIVSSLLELLEIKRVSVGWHCGRPDEAGLWVNIEIKT
jgi:hypothetical protein